MTQDRVVSISDTVLLILLKSSIGFSIADTFYGEHFRYSIPILFYYKLIIAGAPALGDTTIQLTITRSVVRFCSSHRLVMALTTGNRPSKQSTVIQVSILLQLLPRSTGRLQREGVKPTLQIGNFVYRISGHNQGGGQWEGRVRKKLTYSTTGYLMGGCRRSAPLALTLAQLRKDIIQPAKRRLRVDLTWRIFIQLEQNYKKF